MGSSREQGHILAASYYASDVRAASLDGRVPALGSPVKQQRLDVGDRSTLRSSRSSGYSPTSDSMSTSSRVESSLRSFTSNPDSAAEEASSSGEPMELQPTSTRQYWSELWFDSERGMWYAEVPDMLQVLGHGVSEQDAIEDAHFKLCLTIRRLKEQEMDIPRPSARCTARSRSLLYEVNELGNGHFYGRARTM